MDHQEPQSHRRSNPPSKLRFAPPIPAALPHSSDQPATPRAVSSRISPSTPIRGPACREETDLRRNRLPWALPPPTAGEIPEHADQASGARGWLAPAKRRVRQNI